MGDMEDSPKKRGRKKWTIGERQGGLLPGDTKSDGKFTFPLRGLYRPYAPGRDLVDEIPTDSELAELEAGLDLDEEQKWALDFLTVQLRYAILRGDTKTLKEIAKGIEYRKRFSKRQDETKFENNLEWRLYRAALIYSSQSAEGRYPDRRTAKKIAVQEWIDSERAKRKMTAQEIEDFEEQIKALHWSRAFSNLAEFGLFTEAGRPGAPRK